MFCLYEIFRGMLSSSWYSEEAESERGNHVRVIIRSSASCLLLPGVMMMM